MAIMSINLSSTLFERVSAKQWVASLCLPWLIQCGWHTESTLQMRIYTKIPVHNHHKCNAESFKHTKNQHSLDTARKVCRAQRKKLHVRSFSESLVNWSMITQPYWYIASSIAFVNHAHLHYANIQLYVAQLKIWLQFTTFKQAIAQPHHYWCGGVDSGAMSSATFPHQKKIEFVWCVAECFDLLFYSFISIIQTEERLLCFSLHFSPEICGLIAVLGLVYTVFVR